VSAELARMADGARPPLPSDALLRDWLAWAEPRWDKRQNALAALLERTRAALGAQ
jgi:hypothetical protein